MSSWFTVQLALNSASSGTVTITRSVDGGVTFVPIKILDTQAVTSIMNASGVMNFFEWSPDAQWRLEISLTTAGSQIVNGNAVTPLVVYVGPQSSTVSTGTYPNIDPATRYTSAQLAQQNAIRSSAISASDLSGDLTLYKRCSSATIVKLLVPSAVERRLDPNNAVMKYRTVKAASAQVVWARDHNGNAVPSAQSQLDAGLLYVPGQTVVARDIALSPGSPPSSYSYGYPFMADHNAVGIGGFLTLWEAITYYDDMRSPAVNLAAFGLS